MTDAEVLKSLQEAKALLNRKYVEGTLSDYDGRVCSLGAVRTVVKGNALGPRVIPVEKALADAAKELNPHMRERGVESRIIIVNDVYGKEAALSMFTRAIQNVSKAIKAAKERLRQQKEIEALGEPMPMIQIKVKERA